MTKIDIVSGFLGAGKTTLINRLIREAYPDEKLVLIENEFGEIGVDGGFLQEAGVQIAEMNSGCICCSLVGDFSKALHQVISEYHPDRVLIEPSGVGKLSDVTKAVLDAELHDAHLNSAVVVVDVNKCKMYMKNFGEFFNDQITHAGCILFSHTDKTTDRKLHEALELVREQNPGATIITTPAGELDIQILLAAMKNEHALEHELQEWVEEKVCPVCGHHHHDHHDHEHCCEHDHDHHEHHHDHGHCCEHDHDHHEHHHDHEHCCEHDHDHHGHHHADEVFTSWGMETVKKYTSEKITDILNALEDEKTYGMVLRAKGFVRSSDNQWIYFDYVPGEPDVRFGAPAAIGKFCVIGSHLNEHALESLFGIEV
ncbi:MAG: GTP-binding protein [Clostridia bacterium]|nr:GTP-binding protein [Clostridia bacterium]